VGNPETLLNLVDLIGQRRGITDIAFEHLNRDRTALCRAHQSKHDLEFMTLAVATIAAFGQRAGAAFEIARTDIVENKGAVIEMTPGQRAFNALLLVHQPVERLIKLLLVNRSEPEHLAERRGRSIVSQPACSRQLGRRIDEARDQHGDAQHHFAASLHAIVGQHPIETDLAQCAQRRCHMAVRQAAQQRQCVLLRRTYGFVAQHAAQRFDLCRRPI
jgi:hypothetical protein